ncbi:MAG: 1,6-anhydro-N-acetylmuramyl-L-alanine amidase AmpD [Gammaproteobacteria bacterium]|nr:1,6-anhydro-N-acetylmuramyl-L-alanine amidase AmpD [Gammaproteobacteria bacterium]
MNLNKHLRLDHNAEWLEGVRRVISPNQDERPADTEIELIVIHGISLPPGEFGGGYIDQLFTNTLSPDIHPYFSEIAGLRVASHLVINREGEITQYVPFNRRAWHAGVSEFMGRKQCNDFSIGVELEGCDDRPYTEVQYDSLARLTLILRRHWPAIGNDHIVGHCHIAPKRKTDPGPSFDWPYYFALLDKYDVV